MGWGDCMKELTLVQAWQALLDGECVKPNGYTPYKIWDGDLVIWHKDRWTTAAGDRLVYEYHPFFIVPDPGLEPVKSLSFEEAVEKLQNQGDIEIRLPYECPVTLFDIPIAKQLKVVKLGGAMDGDILQNQLFWLDLAERRGWSITEVKP